MLENKYVQRFEEDLYTFINYDELSEQAAAEGIHIKEDKDFYKERVLNFLERNFKGMSKSELKSYLSMLFF